MIDAMQPPAYLDVVERYGLEILTQSGLGDDRGTRRHELFLLVHRWRFNAPTLQFLFDRVFEIRRRHEKMRATVFRDTTSQNPEVVRNLI